MHSFDEKEIDAVRRVFERRKLFRYSLSGPGECDLFEREFSEKFGVPHSLLLSSGTNALVASLRACEVGSGDEVLIPAYTFVATALAILQVGATPVVVNIDESLGISPAEIERRVTPRTRAIIPVHMDGLSADLAPILEIASRRKLFVIEDVAQAIGGSYRGKHLGTWGDLGCFSLNENKTISCGEGGVVATSRRDFYERAFCMHDGSAQFNPANQELFAVTQPFAGSSMRVSEISGAIMRVQLERLDGILSGLRARKRIYAKALGELKRARVLAGNDREGDCGSSIHLRFEDPQEAVTASKALCAAGFPLVPVTARPAHASWKWAKILPEHRTSDYLDSVQILSSTLKMDIEFQKTAEDTERAATRILSVLQSG